MTGDVVVGNITVRTSFAMKELFPSGICEREAATQRMIYSAPLAKQVEDFRHGFFSEATRLQRLGISHRNIVGVNEVFEANGTVYYVMEFIEGMSLSEYVRSQQRKCLDESETRLLLRPIFDAVMLLHENHTTHLDIKPANIMLHTEKDTGLKRPVLIDFGLAKHYNEDGSSTTKYDMTACSPGYAPAEQYGRLTQFSPIADLYAIAATALFCMTGVTPPDAFQINEDYIRQSLIGRAGESCIDAIVNAMRLDHTQRDPTLLYVWFGGNVNNHKPNQQNYGRQSAYGVKSSSENTASENGNAENDIAWSLESVKSQIEALERSDAYREAYELCIECLKKGKNVEFCRAKSQELIPKLKSTATKQKYVTVLAIIGMILLIIFVFGVIMRILME